MTKEEEYLKLLLFAMPTNYEIKSLKGIVRQYLEKYPELKESQLKPQEGESEKDEWELMDDLSKLSKDIYFPVQKFKP